MEQIELALKLDPYNPMLKAYYGVDLFFIRKYDESIVAFQDVLKMDPTNGVAQTVLPMVLHVIGRYDEVIEIWKPIYYNSYIDVVHAWDQGFAKAGYSGALKLEADTLVAQL